MKKYIKLAVPVVLALAAIYACNKLSAPEITAVSGDNPMYVSIEEAESMLLRIMGNMENSATKSAVDIKRTISDKYSITVGNGTKSNEGAMIHIFNFDDECGFAIMSGDRRAEPLLAYALSGSLNEGDTIDNPGLAIYMSRLDDYFADLDTTWISDTSGQIDVYDGFFTFAEMENGPCPVKWMQTGPFNYYSDEYSGGKMPTGCVVTAVAQLMATYRYPDSYNGYSFDWENMIERSNELLEESQPDTTRFVDEKDTVIAGINDSIVSIDDDWKPAEMDPIMLQIAWLMHELGSDDNLDSYPVNDSTATAAYMTNIPRTLENFGYSSGGHLVYYRDGHEFDVISELLNGHYVVMAGLEVYDYSTYWSVNSARSAHCWLVHGLMTYNKVGNDNPYFGTHYYLCNFGWGGIADGYYLSTVFDINKGPVFDEDGTRKKGPRKGLVDDYNFSDLEYMQYIIGIRK